MVEAVGVEPTSESLQQQTLHAYPDCLFMPKKQSNPTKRLLRHPPVSFSPGTLENPVPIEKPAKRRPIPTRGLTG